MKTLKILAVAAVALGAAAIATPAQARDHHHGGSHYSHWNGHHHGSAYVYSGPRYRYYSRPYYRPYYYDDYYSPGYSYYAPYSYGGPSVSFAFGGHGYRHYHHHHR